jgi:Glycosyl transferase family 2
MVAMTALSVIFPCYNEAERLPATLATYLDHLSRVPGEVEVLVVDDGSTDATLAVADAAASGDPRVIRTGPNRGKGFAFGPACSPPRVTTWCLPTPTAPTGRTRSIGWQGRSPTRRWPPARATRARPPGA